MSTSRAAALLTAMIWTSPAIADLADDIRVCAKLTDAALRLKCYDFSAADLGVSRPDAAPPAAAPPAAAPPADLSKATTVKRLSPADLAVETHKWDGQIIETNLNCFYADTNEYRCYDVRGYSGIMAQTPQAIRPGFPT